MKTNLIGTATALMLTSTSAMALGLDRSGQDITSLFEPDGFVELSYGSTSPSVTGVDVLGNSISNVGDGYNQVALSFKMDVTENFSLGLILDQPYGAAVSYEGSPIATMLGGTGAELNSNAVTALGRYRFNDTFSVHAGLRYQKMDGYVTLAGLSYGGLNGYNVDLENGTGSGYLVGAAYERPDIALRVAVTYFSEIENEFDASESIGGVPVLASTTTVSSPEAINLDFQSGIAADTLLFGQIRWAQYSQTILSPDFFAGATNGGSITDIEDNTAYTIGIGRRFTDEFSGTVALGYEPEGTDDLVSPLAPTNGQTSITIGGRYALENVEFTAGIRYTMLGDAQPETGTPDIARADFADNDAMSYGIGVAFRF